MDLAVAVIIGGAFNNIITAFVKDILTPFIGAFGGIPDFSKLSFTLNTSKILYGDFLNHLLSFLIISGVIYFFVLLPMNKLLSIANTSKTTSDPRTRKCPFCLSEIPKEATKCAHCASTIKPAN